MPLKVWTPGILNIAFAYHLLLILRATTRRLHCPACPLVRSSFECPLAAQNYVAKVVRGILGWKTPAAQEDRLLEYLLPLGGGHRPAIALVGRDSPGVPALGAGGAVTAACPLQVPPQPGHTSQISTPKFKCFHTGLKSSCNDQMLTSLLGCTGQTSDCLEEISIADKRSWAATLAEGTCVWAHKFTCPSLDPDRDPGAGVHKCIRQTSTCRGPEGGAHQVNET